jgi:hypothetical protein
MKIAKNATSYELNPLAIAFSPISLNPLAIAFNPTPLSLNPAASEFNTMKPRHRNTSPPKPTARIVVGSARPSADPQIAKASLFSDAIWATNPQIAKAPLFSDAIRATKPPPSPVQIEDCFANISITEPPPDKIDGSIGDSAVDVLKGIPSQFLIH